MSVMELMIVRVMMFFLPELINLLLKQFNVEKIKAMLVV